MFKWLFGEKTQNESGQALKTPTKKDFPQTEEQLHLLRQQIWHDLQKDYGLDPHYIDWLETEEQCNLSSDDLPLIYVWNEQITDEGHLSYSLSINSKWVRETVEQYVHDLDPYFDDVRLRVLSELSQVSRRSMDTTIQKTGMPPSMICEGLHATSNS